MCEAAKTSERCVHAINRRFDFPGDLKLHFTYQVVWEESDIQWASRWDTYLAMSDVQIHWFSIVNSVVVVFFLAGILTMIIVRTLRRDIAKYNEMDDEVSTRVQLDDPFRTELKIDSGGTRTVSP